MPRGKHRAQPEWIEQKNLYSHVKQLEGFYPILRLLHHIPNSGGYQGGQTQQVKMRVIRMVQSGVRSGWPDNELPVSRGGFHGLAIELKAPGSLDDVSAVQQEIHALLRAQGWLVTIRDRWQHAWNDVVQYLPELPDRLAISFIPPLLRDVVKAQKAKRRRRREPATTSEVTGG